MAVILGGGGATAPPPPHIDATPAEGPEPNVTLKGVWFEDVSVPVTDAS